MLTFSGTLLGVVAASVVGVWLGDPLHRRVNSAAVALATLLFLSVASVQLFSIDLRIPVKPKQECEGREFGAGRTPYELVCRVDEPMVC